MNQESLNYVVEKTRGLIASSTCCGELKAAAQSWLDALGTDKEAEETGKYMAELEADIIPIDGLISFAESEQGAQVFGAESGNVAAHARKIKAEGAVYCDCPACAAVEAILKKKDGLLG